MYVLLNADHILTASAVTATRSPRKRAYSQFQSDFPAGQAKSDQSIGREVLGTMPPPGIPASKMTPPNVQGTNHTDIPQSSSYQTVREATQEQDHQELVIPAHQKSRWDEDRAVRQGFQIGHSEHIRRQEPSLSNTSQAVHDNAPSQYYTRPSPRVSMRGVSAANIPQYRPVSSTVQEVYPAKHSQGSSFAIHQHEPYTHQDLQYSHSDLAQQRFHDNEYSRQQAYHLSQKPTLAMPISTAQPPMAPFTPSPLRISNPILSGDPSVSSPFFRAGSSAGRYKKGQYYTVRPQSVLRGSQQHYRDSSVVKAPPSRSHWSAQEQSHTQYAPEQHTRSYQRPLHSQRSTASRDFRPPNVALQTPRDAHGLLRRPDAIQETRVPWLSRPSDTPSQTSGRPQPLPSTQPSLGSSAPQSLSAGRATQHEALAVFRGAKNAEAYSSAPRELNSSAGHRRYVRR